MNNSAPPADDRFTTYTVSEVADILRVSRRTVFTYLKNGELNGFKIGRTVRITPAELERFIQNRQNGQNK